MKFRRFTKTTALAAAVAIVAAAGPAAAVPPWVVTVGSQTTGQVPFSAYTKTGVQFVIAGVAGPVAMSCGAAAAAGVTYPGSYPTGVRVAEIEGIAWSKCLGPAGIAMNIYQAEHSKWRLNLTGLAGPTWTGHIDQINARVVSKSKPGGIPICAYTVTGRANGSFTTTQVAGNNNYTQTFTVNQPNTVANLTVSNVTGCFGGIATGNPASFVGSLKVYNSVGLVGIS